MAGLCRGYIFRSVLSLVPFRSCRSKHSVSPSSWLLEETTSFFDLAHTYLGLLFFWVLSFNSITTTNLWIPSLSTCGYLCIFCRRCRLTFTPSVNPMYYVGFTSATIVASLILFQGFNTDNAAGAVSLLCGFAVTFLGVHVLDVSRRENDALEDSLVQPLRSSVPGESGFFIPRQSLGDRTSLDRWDGQNAAATRSSLSHHRRTSSTNLFDLDSRQAASNRNDGRVPLHGFREEDEWEMDGGERIRRLPSGQRPRAAQTLPRHPDLLTWNRATMIQSIVIKAYVIYLNTYHFRPDITSFDLSLQKRVIYDWRELQKMLSPIIHHTSIIVFVYSCHHHSN